MTRVISGCLIFIVGLAGCRSASNTGGEADISPNWFANSIPNQSEPELANIKTPEQNAGRRARWEDERESSASVTSKNLLTRWLPGNSDKPSSQKRIPLPLSDSGTNGGSSTEEEDDF